MRNKPKIKNVVFDVDGVFTDGKFHYSEEGKVLKVYGPDDADALALLKPYAHIHMISGDKRGFKITKKRIDDMKFPIDLVSTFERIDWFKKHFKLDETIYMGDGIYDSLVMREVAYSIAPANAFEPTKKYADFVTIRKGSEGAVAEAVLHILEKFFKPLDMENLKLPDSSGAWEKKN